jgi:hypothetical protein
MFDGGSQRMNNNLIVYVLALVGCLAIPLGGQGLSTGDRQYLNKTEAPVPDECQIFESAVLATARTFEGVLHSRAGGPAAALSILDDNDVLDPIRRYLRALTALRDCRRALYDRIPSPGIREMIVIPRCELPDGGTIDVAPGLQLSFGAMATERITATYPVMRTETWDVQLTSDGGTSAYGHMVTGIGVCELSSTGHIGLLSEGRLIATYSSGMWEIKNVACRLGKYAGSGRTFQFQGSRAELRGATEFGHDAGVLILDTPTGALKGSPPYWEGYQLAKRKVRIGDPSKGFAVKLAVDLDPAAHRVNFRWDNGNDIVLDWQRGAVVSSNFLPSTYYSSECETKVVCRNGAARCAYDRERFVPALEALPPGAQARLEQ